MKIILNGCTGTKNFGDEMSATVTRSALPGAEWVMVGPGRPGLAAARHPGVRFVRENNHQELPSVLEGASAFIFGPGTVLYSEPSPIPILALEHRIPVALFGIGCLPIKAGSNGARICRESSFRHARDGHSYDAIRAHLHPGDRMSGMPADPMALVAHDALQRLEGREGRGRHNRGVVCLSWGMTHESGPVQERVRGELRCAMDRLGGEWVYAPAAWDGDVIGDFDDDRVFAGDLGLPLAQLSSYEDLADLICGARCVVTSRLHVAVVAWSANVPCAALGPPKIGAFCPEWYCRTYREVGCESILDALERSGRGEGLLEPGDDDGPFYGEVEIASARAARERLTTWLLAR